MYFSVSTGNYLYVYFCIIACFICEYRAVVVPRLCTESTDFSFTVASQVYGVTLCHDVYRMSGHIYVKYSGICC